MLSGLDGPPGSPYLSPTMNRLFLTLLALLTGLATQVSPAQAAVRGAEETQIGAAQTVRGAVRIAQQVVASVAGERVADTALLGPEAALPRFGIASVGVRIGIDRARE